MNSALIRLVVFLLALTTLFAGVYLISSAAYDQMTAAQSCPCPPSLNVLISSSYPLTFVMGLLSGFNPCLIALVSFIVAVSIGSQRGHLRALVRTLSLVSGIFYFQVIFALAVLSIPNFSKSFPFLKVPVAAILFIIGFFQILESSHDLISMKWKRKEEARFMILRTPAGFKKLVKNIFECDNLYLDFLAGALFSVVKFPCTTPLLVIVIIGASSPLQSILGTLAFSLGVVAPVLAIGGLLSMGLITFSRTQGLRYRGRIIQRLVAGTLLLVAAAAVLML